METFKPNDVKLNDDIKPIRNFRERIKTIPPDHLESEDGKLDQSVLEREDKYWINSRGEKYFLE